MKKRFVLPKQVTLPGGFIIRVQEVKLAEDCNAEFSYSPEGTAVISLEKGLSQKQQKYYFSHELTHAIIDYHHLLILEGGTP